MATTAKTKYQIARHVSLATNMRIKRCRNILLINTNHRSVMSTTTRLTQAHVRPAIRTAWFCGELREASCRVCVLKPFAWREFRSGDKPDEPSMEFAEVSLGI